MNIGDIVTRDELEERGFEQVDVWQENPELDNAWDQSLVYGIGYQRLVLNLNASFSGELLFYEITSSFEGYNFIGDESSILNSGLTYEEMRESQRVIDEVFGSSE